MPHELIQANEETMHVLPMSTSVDSPPRPARRPSSAKDIDTKGFDEQGLRSAALDYVRSRRQPEDCSEALISWLGVRVATLETALAEEQKARATIQAEAEAEAAQLVEWVDWLCAFSPPLAPQAEAKAAAYIQPFDVPGGETFLAVQPTSHSVSETVDTLSSTLEGDCDQDCVQWDGTQEECFDASAPWEAHEPSLTPLTGCDVHGEKRLQEGDEQAQCPLRLGLLLMLMLVGTVCMLIESVAVVEFLRPDTCSVDVSSLLHAASTFFTLSPEAFLPPT